MDFFVRRVAFSECSKSVLGEGTGRRYSKTVQQEGTGRRCRKKVHEEGTGRRYRKKIQEEGTGRGYRTRATIEVCTIFFSTGTKRSRHSLVRVSRGRLK